MSDETALWAWFLFDSGLPAQRAKQILLQAEREGVTLAALLARLPAAAASLGLSHAEAAALRPPATLPEVSALRWDDAFYPPELRALPPKLRPALLFYRGPAHLLMQPTLYLAPGMPDEESPDEDSLELLREVVGMLLGEALPVAFRGSAEAALLLEELESCAGEAVFIVGQGLAGCALTAQERALIEAQRLLLVTPLPPSAPENPAWRPVLQQIAQGMARACIATDVATLPGDGAPPTLLLTPHVPPTGQLPEHVTLARTPADALLWLAERQPSPADYPAASATPLPAATDGLLLRDAPPEPPLAPEEALRILEGGGRIPEALRRRLAGG